MIPRSVLRIAGASAVVLSLALGACKDTPELAAEHLRRGDASLAEGRYAQALAAYGHARELAPTDQSVQRAMMIARAHLIAENAARLNMEAVEDARYEATFLLENDKARAPVYLTALANVLARQGDIEGAKAKLAEALAADSTSGLAHSALGAVLMARKEDAGQAKSHFEAALKTRPADLRALVGLGLVELAEGNVARALDHLEGALRVGDDYDARMGLGNAHLRQQKPEEAIPHFQRAAALDPKNAAPLSALGQALLQVGRADEAERALRGALQLQPDLDTQVTLAFALARQKKTEQALALFNAALSVDPKSPAALFGAGQCLEDLGQKEQAAEVYRRVVALSPGGPQPQVLADLQRAATARLAAIPPAPSASASASASAAPGPPKKPR